MDERINIVKEFAGLDEKEVDVLKKSGALGFDLRDKMIENVVSSIELPLGIATNFVINGKPYLVPMAIEEPSVIAAASHAAKLTDGFEARTTAPIMIGQVQLVGIEDFEKAKEEVEKNKGKLLQNCNEKDSVMVKLGGGAKDLKTKILESERGKMLIVELVVDVRDAMGANAVNTMCEAIAPELEKLSGGRARLRIISNLATERIVKATAVWENEVIGKDTVEGILDAYAFALADQYRCTTNNKGIMNGIDAVVVATGNDWRAVESAAHSYACIEGKYKPLAKYYKDGKGNLVGEIELPVTVGIVGGATKSHPIAKIAIKILGVKTAGELAGVIAAVGLANNFAALRAMAREGIQEGHMRLHKRKFGEKG